MASQVSYRSKNNDQKSDCESSSSDGEISSSGTDDEVFSANKRRKVTSKNSNSKAVKPPNDTNTKVSVVPKCLEKKNPWSKIIHEQNSEEIATTFVNSTVGGASTEKRGPESFSRPRFQRRHKVSENDSTRFPSPIDKAIETKIENFTFDKNQPKDNNNGNSNNRRPFKKHNRHNKKHGNNFQHKPKVERYGNKNTNCPVYALGVKNVLNKKRELTPDLSVEDTSNEIAFRLWERKRHLIRKMVTFLGVEKSILLCTKTELVEFNGGLETHKGNRRRTPGGVFLRLIQMDEGIDQKAVQAILDADNEYKGHGKKRKHWNSSNQNKVALVPAEPSPIESSESAAHDDSGIVTSSSNSSVCTPSSVEMKSDGFEKASEEDVMDVEEVVNPGVEVKVNPGFEEAMNPPVEVAATPGLEGTMNLGIEGSVNTVVEEEMIPAVEVAVNPGLDGTMSPGVDATVNTGVDRAANPGVEVTDEQKSVDTTQSNVS